MLESFELRLGNSYAVVVIELNKDNTEQKVSHLYLERGVCNSNNFRQPHVWSLNNAKNRNTK